MVRYASHLNSTINRFGLTNGIIIEVLKSVSFRMQKFKKELVDVYDISFSKKNLSEIIGKIIEKVCADTFTARLGFEVKRALADKEPDLIFTNTNAPMEIKVTSTDRTWTGGEFSKRPFDYLLVSWGGNFDEFFCCLVHLEKVDWKSNFQNNFYGPTLTGKTVYEKKNKIVFLGEFEITNRGNVKIKRERLIS